MQAPAFWSRAPGLGAAALRPAAALYGAVAAWRLGQSGARASVPVLCIGNPTLGGAGKTPTALATAALLAADETPVFLTRGYGGRLPGPLRVDPAQHTAADVGDEPLLLARQHPTVVSRDRPAGARMAAEIGASLIVMDDGFQNPSLRKDCSLLVVDARRGLGNGHVFPAGPLRAPLAAQIARADAIVLVGEQSGDPFAGWSPTLPVFRAVLQPEPVVVEALRERAVLAYAGIADPAKFFRTLEDHGITVAARRSFADHRPYSEADAESLLAEAKAKGLTLVTTEKDAVRLSGGGAIAKLKARSTTLPVALQFADATTFGAFLRRRLRR